MRKNKLYASKEQQYFASEREDIVVLAPDKLSKVLEIGCGEGATLLKLKETGKASEIVAIDINDRLVYPIDNFIVGDIEHEDLPYPEEYFDLIICADVLEHLIDPWETVKKLVRYLNKKGLFILSIPNMRDFKTLLAILCKGDFKYTEEGILDRSHLRFFCKKNIIDLIKGAGLGVEEIHYQMGKRRKLVNAITLNLIKEFLTNQYIVVSRK